MGRQISFGNVHELELKKRIRAGWAKFTEHKQELTNKHYSLHDRLRLFESVVSPTALYGSECWTLTKQMEQLLQRTQRRMLRSILGQGRRILQAEENNDTASSTDVQSNVSNVPTPDNDLPEDERDNLEPWVDWIKRVTHRAEASLRKIQIEDWVQQARKRRWAWAAKVYCDLPENRWSRIALLWDPQVHYDRPKPSTHRRAARPNLRWSDEFVKISRSVVAPEVSWNEVSTNKQFWSSYMDKFACRD